MDCFFILLNGFFFFFDEQKFLIFIWSNISIFSFSLYFKMEINCFYPVIHLTNNAVGDWYIRDYPQHERANKKCLVGKISQQLKVKVPLSQLINLTNIYLPFTLLLVTPLGLWNLSSPTRDWTWAQQLKCPVMTTGLLGEFSLRSLYCLPDSLWVVQNLY